MQMILLAFAVIAVCVAHLRRSKATPLNCREGQREKTPLTMCKNLKMLSRFNTFPHQILTLSPTVKHSLNCYIKLVYLPNLFKNQSDTRNGKKKKKVPLSGLF